MFRFDSDRQVSFFNHENIWDNLIPADSVYRLFREFAPLLIEREDFEGLYCLDNGRPSNEALQMTMACMVQEMLDETDRGMEWMTQVNIEIKYALFMGLDETGIDHSNFGNHRERLMRNKLDILYLDRFTRLMYYLGMLSVTLNWTQQKITCKINWTQKRGTLSVKIIETGRDFVYI